MPNNESTYTSYELRQTGTQVQNALNLLDYNEQEENDLLVADGSGKAKFIGGITSDGSINVSNGNTLVVNREVVAYADDLQSGLATKENTANKIASFDNPQLITDNTYPSAKLVYDQLKNRIINLGTIESVSHVIEGTSIEDMFKSLSFDSDVIYIANIHTSSSPAIFIQYGNKTLSSSNLNLLILYRDTWEWWLGVTTESIDEAPPSGAIISTRSAYYLQSLASGTNTIGDLDDLNAALKNPTPATVVAAINKFISITGSTEDFNTQGTPWGQAIPNSLTDAINSLKVSVNTISANMPTALSNLTDDLGDVSQRQNGHTHSQYNLPAHTSLDAGKFLSVTNENGVTWANGVSSFADLTGQPTDNTNLSNALLAKQDVLVSGTSIKTINSESLLGSGDISIALLAENVRFGPTQKLYTSCPIGVFTEGTSSHPQEIDVHGLTLLQAWNLIFGVASALPIEKTLPTISNTITKASGDTMPDTKDGKFNLKRTFSINNQAGQYSFGEGSQKVTSPAGLEWEVITEEVDGEDISYVFKVTSSRANDAGQTVFYVPESATTLTANSFTVDFGAFSANWGASTSQSISFTIECKYSDGVIPKNNLNEDSPGDQIQSATLSRTLTMNLEHSGPAVAYPPTITVAKKWYSTNYGNFGDPETQEYVGAEIPANERYFEITLNSAGISSATGGSGLHFAETYNNPTTGTATLTSNGESSQVILTFINNKARVDIPAHIVSSSAIVDSLTNIQVPYVASSNVISHNGYEIDNSGFSAGVATSSDITYTLKAGKTSYSDFAVEPSISISSISNSANVKEVSDTFTPLATVNVSNYAGSYKYGISSSSYNSSGNSSNNAGIAVTASVNETTGSEGSYSFTVNSDGSRIVDLGTIILTDTHQTTAAKVVYTLAKASSIIHPYTPYGHTCDDAIIGATWPSDTKVKESSVVTSDESYGCRYRFFGYLTSSELIGIGGQFNMTDENFRYLNTINNTGGNKVTSQLPNSLSLARGACVDMYFATVASRGKNVRVQFTDALGETVTLILGQDLETGPDIVSLNPIRDNSGTYAINYNVYYLKEQSINADTLTISEIS